MGGLTWLHLSDWHQEAKEFDRKVVRDALIKDIEKRTAISQDLETIDFIVFSGDVTFSGNNEEYDLVKGELFDPVLKVCNISPEKLFIVPGNHDIDRTKVQSLPGALLRPLESSDEAKDWLFDSEKRSVALKPFEAFTSFVSKYTHQENPDYANIRKCEVDGKTVALLGINSAWMCCRRENLIGDKGVVVVGEPQIYDSLEEISKFDIKIAALHHPFDWLAEFEYSQIMHRLMKGCDFILLGHRHKLRVDEIHSTIGNCVVIPAGACYNRRTHANAYNFVHLDFKSGNGVAFLRCWNGEDEWREDIDSYAEGKFQFNLPSPLTVDHRPGTITKSYAKPLAFTISSSSSVCHLGSKYSSIQEAVDAANPGDTINVAEGFYKENVHIDKQLSIKGTGEGKTIVDGNQAGSVFIVGNNNANIDVNISDLTIKGGIGTDVSVDDNDAKTYMCGGVILNYGRLTVTFSVISSNTAYYGGGIFNKGTLSLNRGTLVTQNIANTGGGVFNNAGRGTVATVNLSGGSIERNQAAKLGAGIYSGGCYVGLNTLNVNPGSTISGNIAGNSGGGICIFNEGTLNMHGGTISNNNGWTGGGIYSYGGHANLKGGSIYSNTAMNGAGVVNGGGWMALDGVLIHSNTANKNDYGYGGGIQNSGILTLTSGSVDRNTAFNDGGGIWNEIAGKVSGNMSLVHDNTVIKRILNNISHKQK